jgi:hypothetical protein
VYDRLNLPGFGEAEPGFHDFLASVAAYQKNRLVLTDEAIAKVNRHWRFAFEEWGYTLREQSPG